MALSFINTQKAIAILQDIAEKQLSLYPYEDETKFKTNVILGSDRKLDGGYESICMNFENISDQVLNEFEKRRYEIGNSSYIKNQGEEDFKNLKLPLTQIGWF